MKRFYEVRMNEFSVKNNRSEVSYKPHIHMDIEILYIRRGSQTLKIDGVEYVLKQGETAVIFPDVVHEYVYEKNERSDIDAILIICSKKFYGRFFSDMSDSFLINPIIGKDELPSDARYAFDSISAKLSKNMQIAWLVIILSRIFEKVNVLKGKSSPVEDMSYKITTYIDEHFKEAITLKNLADELNVSATYVSRIFSKKFKTNFRTYLGKIRAEYASELLRTTDDKIITIAKNSGFESISTFNRIFREIYGISPRKFRNGI